MRGGIVFFYSLIVSISAMAQSGHYFLTHYNPAEFNFDNYNYDIVQDELGVVHIANRQGLLNYDGSSWWLTKTPFSLFSLAVDDQGTIYTGGRAGFGKFVLNEDLELAYSPIDSLSVDVFDCYYSNGAVYFIDEYSVYMYNIANGQITEIVSSEHGELLDLHGRHNQIWVVSERDGILGIEDGDLVVPDQPAVPNTYVMRGHGEDRLIYYSSSGQFFYANKGETADSLIIDDEGYLNHHTVTQVEWVTDSLVAVSTLTGGIVFITIPAGHVEQIVNHETGLPDDELYNIFTDSEGAVWSTHPNGITIISPNIPFRTFNHYPGLEGVLQQVVPYDSGLYVATTVGVYKLNEHKEYSEKAIYEKVRVAVQEPTDTIEDLPKRKGMFGFLKKKNRKTQEQPPPPGTSEYTYQKKIIKTLKAVRFAFEPIKGITAKTTQFLEFQGTLLAATRAGVFKILPDTAYQIVDTPAHSIFGHEQSGLLFVSTINEDVLVLHKDGQSWVRTGMLNGLHDLISQVIADPQENVWLCGADSVYRLTLDHTELTDVEVFEINNPFFERLYATVYQNQVYFINSSGYFTYSDGKIVKRNDLPATIGLANKFLQSPDGGLWMSTTKGWFGGAGGFKDPLVFLSLVPDPKALAIEQGNIYWVITSRNELFRIDGGKIASLPSTHGLYLKEIRSSNKRLPADAHLSVQQENGSLTFEFATPDYTGIYGTKYQYRLSGLTNKWSSWSDNNNVVTYPFLPANSYTLEMRTKDVLGNIETATPFHFEVQAPYWRRPWFYAAELLFFGGLLFLSFRLSRASGRFTFLSRLLGFMTLILIVEFFQTIAESKLETDESPVIDFFIQAFVALLILPVESVIRGFITGSKKDEEKKSD
jgi:hypothetical protein